MRIGPNLTYLRWTAKDNDRTDCRCGYRWWRRPQGRRRPTGHADWCGTPSRWRPRNADVAEAPRHHWKQLVL